jgi:C-terminal processing protease CtpA/Prc
LIAKDGWVATYATEMTRLNESEYIDLEVEGISRIMNKVMNDLSQSDYIVLDVRFNGGGQDAVSLEILKRFNDKKTKIATQKAKLGAGFSPVQSIFLEPHEKAYTKPVFVLTSRQSASATDLLALASLSLNHVKRIGSRTNGAISTALEKRLPNGWYFSISNEMYFDNNGVCYENTGVPVDYEMNYPEDRQTFFHWIADNVTLDKQNILKIINEFEKEIK